ncbi:AAA-domain-containing protein [Mycena chlorophos]|uniref:AAA-domain-containing protein n=1 Tax=Mycena chlorophos TaxID=658473 RepID=A0A8H6WI81_MYCCL|nr:AAA-domain-containing protein [Mycena chlorophos]
MPRRKRILEVLEIAPPLEPRKPSAAELAVQEENDQRVLALLKYRLEPMLTTLKRKFKRFTKRATEEYSFDPVPMEDVQPTLEVMTMSPIARTNAPAYVDIVNGDLPAINGHVNGIAIEPPVVVVEPQPEQPPPPPPVQQMLYDIDLERMHTYLYKGRYITPDDFLEDVRKIVHDAATRQEEDIERLYRAQAMLNATEVSMHEFDPQLKLECERMAVRERARRAAAKEAVKAAKAKAKGKGKENGNASGSNTGTTGTRRSARNNGLQPELTITDPGCSSGLKRAGSDGAGTDLQGGGHW